MFNCSCYDDYDRAEVWNQVQRTASKLYYCCECGCEIVPGDRYEYIFAVCLGEASSHHTCKICASIAATVQSCARTPGRLWDDFHEDNCKGHADDFCMCPDRTVAVTG